MLRIENQAIVFALLCKYTVETEGEKGREVIQKGMIRYGRKAVQDYVKLFGQAEYDRVLEFEGERF